MACDLSIIIPAFTGREVLSRALETLSTVSGKANISYFGNVQLNHTLHFHQLFLKLI